MAESDRSGARGHRILSLHVDGGFLDGLHAEFESELNCIIGGRGTGKTTALEFLGYALGTSNPVDTESQRAARKLVESNLGGGTVRLEVETRHGMRYVLQRRRQQPTSVTFEDGRATDVSFDHKQIFTADVYSQNEIESIATQPRHRRTLVDKFTNGRIRELEQEMVAIVGELADNGRQIRSRMETHRALLETASESAPLREKLQGLVRSAPDASAEDKQQHERQLLREREARLMRDWQHQVDALAREAASTVATTLNLWTTSVPTEMESGENAELLREVGAIVAEAHSAAGAAISLFESDLKAVSESLRESAAALAHRHAVQKDAYEAHLAASHEEAGRAAERTALQKRLAEVEAAAQELSVTNGVLAALREKRQELADRLADARNKRFEERQRVAEYLNAELAPTIQVRIEQAEDRAEYRNLLVDSLKKRGFPPVSA